MTRRTPSDAPSADHGAAQTDRGAAQADHSRGGADAAPGVGHGMLVVVRKVFPVSTMESGLLLGVTFLLLAFGLVMVFSSSIVEEFIASGDVWGALTRQGLFAIIAVPLMLLASRVSITWWKRLAWPGLALGIVLQLLVFTPLGYESGGNLNWIEIAGFTMQPSEFVKLALCVWLGMMLTVKQPKLDNFWHAWLPILPFAGLALFLVMEGNDFGTLVILAILVLGAVFFAGVKVWHLLLPLVVAVLVAVPVVLSSGSRVRRIETFLQGCTIEQYHGDCWQQFHGLWALASGGWFGVGLGNSQAKWSWLAEAHNDYIFAIIGEELGLVGATIVVLLYVVMALVLLRIIWRSDDQFVRVVTGAVFSWVIGQAFVNIAVVLGLLPVLGVPLPLVSAGGSQLIATMIAIGVVLSFARTLPPPPLRPMSVTGSRRTRRRPSAADRGATTRTAAARTRLETT